MRSPRGIPGITGTISLDLCQEGVDGEGDQSDEIAAEAVHLVTAISGDRQVRSAKLAAGEFHRLSQALLAKGLSLGLLVRAAEQYRDKKGPFERWETLRAGITAIVEDVARWAADVERRPKRIAPPRPPPPDLVKDSHGRLVERTALVCILTPEQLAEQARRLNELSTTEPTSGEGDGLQIDRGLTSQEQRAFLSGTIGAIGTGRR
jgi:hypothetical protein